MCRECLSELTETDQEAGRCTQCETVILKPIDWLGIARSVKRRKR